MKTITPAQLTQAKALFVGFQARVDALIAEMNQETETVMGEQFGVDVEIAMRLVRNENLGPLTKTLTCSERLSQGEPLRTYHHEEGLLLVDPVA